MESKKNTFKNRMANLAMTTVLTVGFATVGLGVGETNAAQDRDAFRAAAEKCGMPKPGEGRPTEEQEACMTAAGFSRPKGPPGGGKRGQRPPPQEDSSSTEDTSAQ